MGGSLKRSTRLRGHKLGDGLLAVIQSAIFNYNWYKNFLTVP